MSIFKQVEGAGRFREYGRATLQNCFVVKEKTTKAKFILIYKLFKDLAGGVLFVFLEKGYSKYGQDGGTDRLDDHITSLTWSVIFFDFTRHL